MNIEERQSGVLEAIRFPLIVLVVFIHGLPVTSNSIYNWDLWDTKLYYTISEAIKSDIGAIAVPCFFLISGYFFFRKMNSWSWGFYKKQLTNRVTTLLIPYIIWNLAFILFPLVRYYTLGSSGDGFYDNHTLIQNTNWIQLMWAVPGNGFSYPMNFPLWYLRDLICMSLISPLFYLLFKYTRGWGLLFLFTFYLAYGGNIPGFSTTALLFFGAGAYWGIQKENLLVRFHKYRTIFYLTSFVLLCILFGLRLGQYDQMYISLVIHLFCLFGVISTINATNRLYEKTRIIQCLLKLSPTVFFIYVTHGGYIIGFIRGIYFHTPLSYTWMGLLLSYFLIVGTTLCVCIAIYYVLYKISPRMLFFLTGRGYSLKTTKPLQ